MITGIIKRQLQVLSRKKKYCDVCKEKHMMGEEYDIFDCMLHDREKNPREDNVEIWKDGKWVKREEFYEVHKM